MGYRFRWTIAELRETTNKKILQSLIVERKSFCTNCYAPLYKRLTELEKWVNLNIPDK